MSLVRILYPRQPEPELLYTAEVLFRHRLDIRYRWEVGEETAPDPVLRLENGRSLTVHNALRDRWASPGTWLRADAIPDGVDWFSCRFCGGVTLPVIFGSSSFSVEPDNIHCGIDLFASIFFMLSRWEEYVMPDRDSRGRFPGSASCASRNGFLGMPVVDMYIEMLWNILVFLGYEGKRKADAFCLEMQHDIDEIRRYRNPGNLLCIMGGDLLDPGRRRFIAGRIPHYLRISRGKVPDPYDSLEWMMDREERHGVRGRYYFMAGGNTRFDAGYGPENSRIRALVREVTERGHTVGFHPSYGTSDDNRHWSDEKKCFEKVHGLKVVEGRQHYLRFSIPGTWQIWEDNGMETDGSMYYADTAGFRCGTCHPFPVFNIRTRKQLKLIEKPLIVMDTTFQKYMRTGVEEAEREIMTLAETVRKYRGIFTVLWHNTSIFHENRPGYRILYEKILNLAGT